MTNNLCAAPPSAKHSVDEIVETLATQGYVFDCYPLEAELTSNLFALLLAQDQSRFKTAGVGRELDHQVNRFVRTDEILWLDNDQSSVALQTYLTWIETLRLAINRRLYLGLFDYECHFATYSEGAYYKRHTDAFNGERNRLVSTILYLNPNWQHGDGGELVLYSPAMAGPFESERTHVVEPTFGKLVLFLSEQFPHEVLVSHKARYSLTGWFRVRQHFKAA